MQADVEYKLAAATDVTAFEKVVSDLLTQGFKPHSDLHVTPHKDESGQGMQYTQGFVRRMARPPAPITPPATTPIDNPTSGLPEDDE